MHRVEVVPWSIAATYWVIDTAPGVAEGGEGAGELGSPILSARGRQHEGQQTGERRADHGADDGHPRVAPLGTALPLDGQHRVGDARTEVSSGVDRVTGRPAE